MERVLIAGRYRLLELVGRGGMGRVWRARDEVLHREVAVKQVVPPAWLTGAERDEVRRRTLREARTAARVDHPNVVKVYDVVSVGDSPWIVMAYVPSRTLQDVLDVDGPLPPARAAALGLDLLAALRAAHTAGVLHRDVKPPNVLIAHDGRALLTDFGLAVFDGGDGAMTRPGMVLGSPQYVAPERAAEGVSNAAADLWSLGATLYAAVEGRSPYARSTAMATLSALAAYPPDPAANAGPLAPVLAGLLRRDPADRADHDETQRRLTAAAAAPPPVANTHPATAAGPEASTGPGAPTGPAASPGPAGTTEPAAGARGVTGPAGRKRSRGPLARRWALAGATTLVVVAAGVGTALAVADDPGYRADGFVPTGGPVRDDRDGATPGDARVTAAGPGRPGHRPPPPGRGAFPPPPFPCVRPDVVGEPVVASSPPAGERFRPPSGWVWHADRRGFRVALPAGWRHSGDGAVACFQDPATGRTLSVAGPQGVVGGGLERLRAVRERELAAGTLPAYEEFRLGVVGPAAEWECGWETPHGGRLRAVQAVPAEGPAAGWTLGWITHEHDWGGATAQFATARASLRVDR